MIKPKLTFFQVEIKSLFLKTSKTNQSSFDKASNTFYPIDM